MADYTTPDIYESYVEDGGTLSYEEFTTVCEEFNKRVMEKIIYEGRYFHMGNNLSGISVLRIERDYSKKAVNWKKSNELKQKLLDEGKKLYDDETGEGHKWLVYYTDDWYCRFYWSKKYCRVPNKKVYQFVATRGAKGNKTKLKEHLRESKLNHRKYQKAR